MERRNLFARLMPARPAAASRRGVPRSFGREDYITEVVAAVLDADAVEGGRLVHEVLRTLYKIEIDGDARVRTQQEYPDRVAGQSLVDMEVRTPTDVVFFENKTGAPIGLRKRTEGEGHVSQLAKYQEELDHASVPEARRHLVVLGWSPQGSPASSRYYRGHKYWWDLWQVVYANAGGSAYVEGLRREMLEFFQRVQLDPPEPITEDSSREPATVQRLLAMAVDRAATRGLQIRRPRPVTWPGYMFEMPDADGKEWSWYFGFSQGSPTAAVVGDGYRIVDIPEGFFGLEPGDQAEALAEALIRLPAAARDLSRTNALPENEFLDTMGKYRELVEKLLETNGNAWSIRIGSKEARLWRPDGNGIIVYASAYGRGPQLRVWCPNADLQDRVHNGLLEWGIVEQRERTQQSVTFLLANADGELIPDLCARLDEL